jgi:hypothetical protein
VAKSLPLAEQVTIAGELAVKCETYYATWLAIAGGESRAKYRDALGTHPDILMSMQGAHMFALICGLHSLFERKANRINLPTLSALADDVAAEQLVKSAEVAGKVEKLRHNLNRYLGGHARSICRRFR